MIKTIEKLLRQSNVASVEVIYGLPGRDYDEFDNSNDFNYWLEAYPSCEVIDYNVIFADFDELGEGDRVITKNCVSGVIGSSCKTSGEYEVVSPAGFNGTCHDYFPRHEIALLEKANDS